MFSPSSYTALADPLVVLKQETETCMRLLGAEKVSDLNAKHVSHSDLEARQQAYPVTDKFASCGTRYI